MVEGEIVKKLQPRSQEHSVTYTCIGVSFDVEQVLRRLCPRIFESLCVHNLEAEEDREHVLPAMFARIGKEFTHLGKELSKPFQSSGTEEKVEEAEEPIGLEEERDHFLGVPAMKAAMVLGFLEQPWSQMMPNVPILTPKDVKYLMEHWQTFSQRYMIKLKWMELVRAPCFVAVSDRMLKVDNVRLSDGDRQRLLPFCLEFWNKPEINYRWKLGLKHTDEVVPLWKTRMYFTRDPEEGLALLFSKSSVPIWNVVDEEAMKRLEQIQPNSLRGLSFQHIVSLYPDSFIDQSSPQLDEVEPRHKPKTLDDFEPHIDSRKKEHSRMTSSRPMVNGKVDLSVLTPSLVTEFFHMVLRCHGVTPELQTVFRDFQLEQNLPLQGLTLPNRFQRKSTRADSKAESLIVTLGELAESFTYLDVSHSTLSSESLEILGPHLSRVVDLSLEGCVGIHEWGFLLHMRETLRQLNVSKLRQCGNGEQLCAMVAGLKKLQFLDVSYSSVNISFVLFHVPQLKSLLSLNLLQSDDKNSSCVTDEWIESLVEIETLRALYLPGQNLSPTSIFRLGELPELTELGFVQLIGLGKHSPLATLTQLTALSIEDSEMYDDSVEGVLGSLTSLTRLSLARNCITGEGVSILGGMTNLQILNLSDNQVGLNRNADHQSFSALASSLTDLDLSGNPIVNMRPWMARANCISHLGFLLEMTQMVRLKLDNKLEENGFEDAGVNYLRNMTQLTFLSLRGQALTDNCISKIVRLPRIRELDLGSNQITNSAIKMLRPLKELRILHIDNSILSDTALVEMASLPTLRTVTLSNTRITANAIDAIEKKLPMLEIKIGND